MELLNEMYKAREAGAAGSNEWKEATDIYLKMLAPVAPHIAEELWTTQMGKPYSIHQQVWPPVAPPTPENVGPPKKEKPYSIHQQEWPKVDEAAAKEDVIEIPVQVNGKVRDRVTLPAEAGEDEIMAAVMGS